MMTDIESRLASIKKKTTVLIWLAAVALLLTLATVLIQLLWIGR
jgi:hypothetical protein